MTHHLNIGTLVRYSSEIHLMYRLHYHEIFKWMWMLFALTFRFFHGVCVWLVHIHIRCVKIHFHWNDYTALCTCMRVYAVVFTAIWIFRKLLCSFHCRNAEIFVNGGKNCRYRKFALIFRFATPFCMTYISEYTLSIVTNCSLTFQLSYL